MEKQEFKKTGKAGQDLIKGFESCVLRAYPDPGTGREPWTIGWGHTGSVHPGDVMTQQQADEWFLWDLAEFEKDVNLLVKVPINQNQFDALTSFAYNVGPDMDHDGIAEGLGDSTLLKKLNQGDYLGASQEFGKWTRGGNGQVLPGLVRRREAEKQLFLKKEIPNVTVVAKVQDPVVCPDTGSSVDPSGICELPPSGSC